MWTIKVYPIFRISKEIRITSGTAHRIIKFFFGKRRICFSSFNRSIFFLIRNALKINEVSIYISGPHMNRIKYSPLISYDFKSCTVCVSISNWQTRHFLKNTTFLSISCLHENNHRKLGGSSPWSPPSHHGKAQALRHLWLHPITCSLQIMALLYLCFPSATASLDPEAGWQQGISLGILLHGFRKGIYYACSHFLPVFWHYQHACSSVWKRWPIFAFALQTIWSV